MKLDYAVEGAGVGGVLVLDEWEVGVRGDTKIRRVGRMVAGCYRQIVERRNSAEVVGLAGMVDRALQCVYAGVEVVVDDAGVEVGIPSEIQGMTRPEQEET